MFIVLADKVILFNYWTMQLLCGAKKTKVSASPQGLYVKILFTAVSNLSNYKVGYVKELDWFSVKPSQDHFIINILILNILVVFRKTRIVLTLS